MSNPVLLGQTHIAKALSDPNFYDSFPEFRSLRVKLESMKININRGCKSCKERRIVRSLTSDFVSILSSSDDGTIIKLKKYLGTENLLVNMMDTVTRQVTLKRL